MDTCCQVTLNAAATAAEQALNQVPWLADANPWDLPAIVHAQITVNRPPLSMSMSDSRDGLQSRFHGGRSHIVFGQQPV